MAGYAFQSLQARQTLQTLWEEQGQTAKALAKTLSVPLSTVYTELRRGRTGDWLTDQRLKYDAKMAQPKMQQELEQRGRKTAKA